MEKIKTKLGIFFLTIIIAVLLSLPVMSAGFFDDITLENGKLVGLNLSTASEYTYVTLENYNAGLTVNKINLDNNTFTTITSNTVFTQNGIICVRLKQLNNEKKFFYVMGEDGLERSDVGYKGHGKNAVYTQEEYTSSWIAGTWTHPYTFHVNPNGTPLYMSTDSHISGSLSKSILDDAVLKGDTVNGPLNNQYRLQAEEEVESIFYRYAYESHEILPIEELQNITFDVSVRQGSLIPYSPSGAPLKTKLVLYTMNETGNVTAHAWTDMATYTNEANRTRHTATIKSAFPNATGWVVGFEIYPYGDLPEDVQFKGTGKTNTCFTVNFISAAYNTVWNNDAMVIALQYNGANTAYIEGYADGTFRPDENITKAEAAALLSRLALDGFTLPSGYYSKIPDVTVDAWYHDAVAFLEYNKAFDYLDGGKLYPDDDITRGELAQLIYGAAKFVKKSSKSNFIDLKDTYKYYPAISYLAELGTINGYPDGTFRPDAKVSRAEAVTMINRLINLTANEHTVVKETLDNVFPDIEGHWAEYQVLIASNDNVKTLAHIDNTSGLTEDDEFIYIETDHVKVTISKNKGRLYEVINKDNTENVLSTTLNPWFASVTNSSGAYFEPIYADVVDGRLHIVFSNDTEAYFLVEAFPNYFTVKLDSEIPHNVAYLDYAQISVNCEFSETDYNTYRISAVPMTTSTDPINRPGGSYKKTIGRVLSKMGDVIGAKIGITFSQYGGLKTGEHREYLKEIVLAIDIREGITSTKGAPFAYDAENDALFYDYVIQSSGLSPSNATETGQVAKANSIEIIDFHRGSNSFIQGDFNFVSARLSGETDFIPASTFKERIADKLNAEGVLLSMHTYSSLIFPAASTILSVPKWQQQIEYYPEDVLTLTNNITSTTSLLYVNESLEGRTFYKSGATAGTSANDVYSGYILVDEEIMLVTSYSATNGTLTVSRAQCGTTATAHDKNSKIRQLLSYYGGLQPIVGSELYYYVAYLTGRACVEGGFDMIYLDGFESIEFFGDPDLRDYYYAEFIRAVLEAAYEASYEMYGNYSKIPMMEGSRFPVSFWSARGKAGAVDHANRQYKKYNRGHLNSNKNHFKDYLTATSGWFNFAPGSGNTYINTYNKTLFRDDIDLLGVMGVAYDMSTVLQPFSLSNFKHFFELIDNYTYFNTYSRLREGGYFSEDVKEALKVGIEAGKEYKIFKQADGSWAFREMYYDANIIRDMADGTFATGNGNNQFRAQKPFIRIEQRYSTDGNNEEILLDFSEKLVLSTLENNQKNFEITTGTKLLSKPVLKVNVKGNGSETGAILITLTSGGKVNQNNRIDYFIPLNFTGERDIILMDSDNADFDGYSFSNIKSDNSTDYATFRNEFKLETSKYVTISTTGDVSGVTMDDIRVCSAIDTPAQNPSVTIGSNTITFNVTLKSGEYIEYYPDENKAYINYYKDYTGDDGTKVTKQKYTEEITNFTGSVTVPTGDYTFTYGGISTTGAPLRAKVMIGLTDYDNVIENPDSWIAPNVYMPENNEKVKLRAP